MKYDKPLGRQREIMEICRAIWRREVVVHDGPNYQLPLPQDQGTGLGKPLKLINHPVREDIPIYLASLGPKNVELTAEVADGWLPAFFHPDKADGVWKADLDAGLAKRDPARPLQVSTGGALCITDDDEMARKIRDAGRFMTALYVGGMGAKGKNFYNNIFRKYGYEQEAEQIQDLYLDGKKDEAMALVPQDYLDATALVGDEGFVRRAGGGLPGGRGDAPADLADRPESDGRYREGEELGQLTRHRSVRRCASMRRSSPASDWRSVFVSCRLSTREEQPGAGLRLERHQVGDPNSVVGENLDVDPLVERLGDETERPLGFNDGEAPGTRLVPDDELLVDGLLRYPDGAGRSEAGPAGRLCLVERAEPLRPPFVIAQHVPHLLGGSGSRAQLGS